MKTKDFVRWVTLGAIISFLISKVFSSKEGKVFKKDLKDSTKKISLAIAEETKKLGAKINKKKYEAIVEQVLAKYLKGQKIAAKTKNALTADLKAAWTEIKKLK